MEYTTKTILNLNYHGYVMEVICDECKKIFIMEKTKRYNYCPFCGKEIIQLRS
jgi:predicted RNA-binding Zn-ribbon protein involved in translation (DUF1610 family)